MNARGEGVQLQRAPCFTEACRALWPGAGHMHQCVVDAFSVLYNSLRTRSGMYFYHPRVEQTGLAAEKLEN